MRVDPLGRGLTGGMPFPSEILAGVAIGPSVLGLAAPTEVLEVFAELGVVFLLFWVGLETRLSEMLAVGRSAAAVGAVGVILPFAGGLAFATLVLREDSATAIFVGVALVATSVGITSAVLIGLGALGGRAAKTILGAAVIDDILAMLLLAVAVGLEEEGQLDLGSLGGTVVLAIGFVLFFALGGTRVLQRRPRLLHAPRFSESPLLPAVIICLGLAALAAHIGLAAIIGAFLAGMMVAETKEQHPIEDEVAPLYAFFFALIGIEVSLGEFTDAGTLGLLAAITVLAVVTKYAGARIGALGMTREEAHVVGIGMVPRGEVGIIVAGIGASAGVIDARLFAVIVGMSVLTTLVVPPLLRRALAADPALARARRRPRRRCDGAAGVIDFCVIPPPPIETRTRMTQDQREYKVAGMTCAHCVAAVTEEVEQVPGVEAVSVELAGGRLAVALGEPTATAIFVGVALVATSVGITSAVLISLGALGGRAAKTILGAAVIDDILAMLLLAVAVGLGETGEVDLGSLGITVALAVGFVAFFALGGTRLLQRRPRLLHAPRFSESPLLPAVILCLGLAALAAHIGLAAIIGAFLAGMMVAETKEQHPIEGEVAPLYAFFPPFFFAFIGMEVSLGEFADAATLGLLAAVTALAVVTKYVGARIGARGMSRREGHVVGLGMVPRGEVGIIVAGIGASAGVIDAQLFAVIVGMSVLTTLVVPPLLRRALAADPSLAVRDEEPVTPV